jgi:hypothetical protein
MNRLQLSVTHQFTLAYLLCEVGLVAIALAAGRVAYVEPANLVELKAVLCCLSLVALSGALGGLCLRMALGLVAGGIFAVASMPVVLLTFGAAG